MTAMPFLGSAEQQALIAEFGHVSERRDLAASEVLTSAAAAILSKDTSPWVLQALLANARTPMGIVTEHAGSPFEEVRSAMADRHDLPGEIQRVLALDSHPDVIAALGENPSLDPGLVDRMMRYEAGRYGLAGNTSAPQHVLRLLSSSDSGLIQQRVAANPGLVWDRSLPARFAIRHNLEGVRRMLSPLPEEVWRPLGESWEGTLATLAEATCLVEH